MSNLPPRCQICGTVFEAHALDEDSDPFELDGSSLPISGEPSLDLMRYQGEPEVWLVHPLSLKFVSAATLSVPDADPGVP